MDASDLANIVITNYQFLAFVITTIGFLITLFIILYNVGKKLGELEDIKDVIDSRLLLLDEKYKTNEKIQEVDKKLETFKIQTNAERAADKETILAVEAEITEIRAEIAEIREEIWTGWQQGPDPNSAIVARIKTTIDSWKPLPAAPTKFIDPISFTGRRNPKAYLAKIGDEIKVHFSNVGDLNITEEDLIPPEGRIGIGREFLVMLENRLAPFKMLLDQEARRSQ
jgi:hypothetical protein